MSTDFFGRVLETRRSLAQLYSNLSLQHAAFLVGILIAFVTIISDFGEFAKLPYVGLSVFLAMEASLVVAGVFEFSKALLWSAVATCLVERKEPDIVADKDFMGQLVEFYKAKAKEKNPRVAKYADKSFVSICEAILAAFVVFFMIGLAPNFWVWA